MLPQDRLLLDHATKNPLLYVSCHYVLKNKRPESSYLKASAPYLLTTDNGSG